MSEITNQELIERLKKNVSVDKGEKDKNFEFGSALYYKLRNKHPVASFLGALVAVTIFLVCSYFYKSFGLYTVSDHYIHWHAHLTITIKGVHTTIPAGVGLKNLSEHPDILHTHEPDNLIHMEMEAPVKARQIMLGEFFKVWGKTFTHDCIFDYCDGRDGELHFLVNGRLNTDFENYVMRDKDEIEILLE